MKELRDLKLFESLNIIRKSRPHLFSMLDISNIELNSDKIPTACVSWDKKAKKFLILIGNEFSDNLDALNLSAIIEHELLHILFEHLFDSTMPDKKTANIAMDSIINDSIDLFKSDRADKILDSRIYLSKINKTFNVKNNTSLDVYKFLKENPDKMPENQKGDSDNNSDNGIDSHEGFSNNDGGQNESENSTLSSGLEREIAESLLKNHIEKNLEKFQGAGHAEIDRIVKEKTKIEYNFKTLFSNAVKKSLRAESVKTWKKPSRRLGDIIKGQKKAIIPKVLLLIDTSGSINDEIISKINWQIDFLSKFYSFTIIWGDTKLEGRKEVKKGQKVDIEYSGYGGTDLGFYKDITDKENFDLVIFNTDGYIPEIDKNCKIKKVFCIFDGGKEVKGYKNIMIKYLI
jgi:predicted metal-dependent peptidase